MTYQEQPQSRAPRTTGQGAGDALGPAGLSAGASLAASVVEGPGEPSELACPHLPRVSLYHDDELNEDERRFMSDHLAACQPCAEALAFFGRVSSTFSAAAPERLGLQSKERLCSLASGPQYATGEARGQVPAHVRWVRRLTAIAAVLFIVAICRLVYQHHSFFGEPSKPAVEPRLPVGPVNPPAPAGQQYFVPSERNRPAGGDARPAPSTGPTNRFVE